MSKAVGQRAANQRKKEGLAFEDRKEQLYAQGRKNVEKLVKEEIAAIEEARAKILALKQSRPSLSKQLSDLKSMEEAQETTFQGLASLYSEMVEELGQKRSEMINSASKMNQTNPRRRDGLHKELYRKERKQLEETKKKLQDVTDAENLIKNLKSTLRLK